ncbi:hypothetical protein KL86PLE_90573 [uncultured Pleomorphomonas sp.]|uniref:Uncharacterized protein n=1 Tax=uncultured Pleomorphomonas sp. TaxID=442121 RepID=A0A212LPZ0_9HYPH|nr:hypothetical protein KL86PLE_90573 [uncultured Pleomorphomonas sp.]
MRTRGGRCIGRAHFLSPGWERAPYTASSLHPARGPRLRGDDRLMEAGASRYGPVSYI